MAIHRHHLRFLSPDPGSVRLDENEAAERSRLDSQLSKSKLNIKIQNSNVQSLTPMKQSLSPVKYKTTHKTQASPL